MTVNHSVDQASRFRGCLLGLAIGDAVGTTLEFCPPGTFEPIDDMDGGGPFKLEPGQWTDDTSMALCLAFRLVECVDACRLLATILVRALGGMPKSDVLLAGADRLALTDRIAAIARGGYRGKAAHEIRGTGYVVQSLEASLWAFDSTTTFRDADLAAANLGDDADTTAAICGQVAGAFYGDQGIPAAWLDRLTMRADIASLADKLHARGGSIDTGA